ncbi:chromobox protein homolog 2-like [Athene cunicularia]|uniref:chromobox protein homolog 2-like n=1 Tax=Athene cunicularia TaxID=194338 RepID=UPI000EF6EABD|nr:chromobox protein homolog 2-like [Athene cunicularia]
MVSPGWAQLGPGVVLPLSRPRNPARREHEKEVQNRKRGKRPRGRPRKHVEPEMPAKTKSSSSSSSTSSSSSSSDEEDESDLEAKRGPRSRETHPVPQKKAQILVAKPEMKDASRKKRGRKPLPPEQKAARRTVNLTKVLKTSRKEVGGSAKLLGKLQPQHSSQGSGMAVLKDPPGALPGLGSAGSSAENLPNVMKSGSASPSRAISWQSSIVHYMNRMSQSQNSAETSPLGRLALKSQASSKSGLGLDLKMRSQKGSGELGLSMQGPKTAKAPSSGAGGDQKSGGGEMLRPPHSAKSPNQLPTSHSEMIEKGNSPPNARNDCLEERPPPACEQKHRVPRRPGKSSTSHRERGRAPSALLQAAAPPTFPVRTWKSPSPHEAVSYSD